MKNNTNNRPLMYDIEQHANSFPTKTAIRSEYEAITYKQLSIMVKDLIKKLVHENLQNKIIVVITKPCVGNIIAALAIEHINAIYCPIDSELSQNKIERYINNINPSWILYTNANKKPNNKQSFVGNIYHCTNISHSYFRKKNTDNKQQGSLKISQLNRNFIHNNSVFSASFRFRYKPLKNYLYSKIQSLNITGIDTTAYTSSPMSSHSLWQMICPLLKGGEVFIINEKNNLDVKSIFERISAEGVTTIRCKTHVISTILKSAYLIKLLQHSFLNTIVLNNSVDKQLWNTWNTKLKHIELITPISERSKVILS